MTTLSNTFGRTDRACNVHLLDDEGRPVTTLDDVDGIYPVGSDKSVHYDHPEGIVITIADARKLSIEIDGQIEEDGAQAAVLDDLYDEITDGMIAGVSTGAWDFNRADNDAKLAIEFYADADPRLVSLNDSYRAALVRMIDHFIAGKRIEAAA